MWIVFAIMAVLFWGSSDVFFKKSMDEDGTAIDLIAYNGIVYFLITLIYMLIKGVDFNFMAIVRYLPAGLCYLASMFSYYAAFKYEKVAIVSPVANASCAITSLLCVFVLKQSLDVKQVIAVFAIVVSIMLLSMSENSKEKITKKIFVIGFALALGYTLLDGFGSFFDEVFIDKYVCDLEMYTEDDVIVAYATQYFIAGVICLIIKLIRDKKRGIINKSYFKPNKYKFIGTLFETGGEYAYVYTYANADAAFASPFIASFCAVSVLLSRIFLKEKVSKRQYILISIIIAGMFVLGIE